MKLNSIANVQTLFYLPDPSSSKVRDKCQYLMNYDNYLKDFSDNSLQLKTEKCQVSVAFVTSR